MTVSPEDMYGRLKDFDWAFNGAEYDLYSAVEIDAQDCLLLEINRIVFRLDNFIIEGASARINASCDHGENQVRFAFTGKRVAR